MARRNCCCGCHVEWLVDEAEYIGSEKYADPLVGESTRNLFKPNTDPNEPFRDYEVITRIDVVDPLPGIRDQLNVSLDLLNMNLIDYIFLLSAVGAVNRLNGIIPKITDTGIQNLVIAERVRLTDSYPDRLAWITEMNALQVLTTPAKTLFDQLAGRNASESTVIPANGDIADLVESINENAQVNYDSAFSGSSALNPIFAIPYDAFAVSLPIDMDDVAAINASVDAYLQDLADALNAVEDLVDLLETSSLTAVLEDPANSIAIEWDGLSISDGLSELVGKPAEIYSDGGNLPETPHHIWETKIVHNDYPTESEFTLRTLYVRNVRLNRVVEQQIEGQEEPTIWQALTVGVSLTESEPIPFVSSISSWSTHTYEDEKPTPIPNITIRLPNNAIRYRVSSYRSRCVEAPEHACPITSMRWKCSNYMATWMMYPSEWERSQIFVQEGTDQNEEDETCCTIDEEINRRYTFSGMNLVNGTVVGGPFGYTISPQASTSLIAPVGQHDLIPIDEHYWYSQGFNSLMFLFGQFFLPEGSGFPTVENTGLDGIRDAFADASVEYEITTSQGDTDCDWWVQLIPDNLDTDNYSVVVDPGSLNFAKPEFFTFDTPPLEIPTTTEIVNKGNVPLFFKSQAFLQFPLQFFDELMVSFFSCANNIDELPKGYVKTTSLDSLYPERIVTEHVESEPCVDFERASTQQWPSALVRGEVTVEWEQDVAP